LLNLIIVVAVMDIAQEAME